MAAQQIEQVRLPRAPESVRAARQLVRRVLGDVDDDTRDTAVLLMSEVATNAFLHGSGAEIGITITRQDQEYVVAVADASPVSPRARHASIDAATGRGLALLTDLATRWGIDDAPPPFRKTVWFTVRATDEVRG
jgi:anti-sigma regulatory factor (Ser/Thr protein kinase)